MLNLRCIRGSAHGDKFMEYHYQRERSDIHTGRAVNAKAISTLGLAGRLRQAGCPPLCSTLSIPDILTGASY